jgi:hypothetical protein
MMRSSCNSSGILHPSSLASDFGLDDEDSLAKSCPFLHRHAAEGPVSGETDLDPTPGQYPTKNKEIESSTDSNGRVVGESSEARVGCRPCLSRPLTDYKKQNVPDMRPTCLAPHSQGEEVKPKTGWEADQVTNLMR